MALRRVPKAIPGRVPSVRRSVSAGARPAWVVAGWQLITRNPQSATRNPRLAGDCHGEPQRHRTHAHSLSSAKGQWEGRATLIQVDRLLAVCQWSTGDREQRCRRRDRTLDAANAAHAPSNATCHASSHPAHAASRSSGSSQAPMSSAGLFHGYGDARSRRGPATPSGTRKMVSEVPCPAVARHQARLSPPFCDGFWILAFWIPRGPPIPLKLSRDDPRPTIGWIPFNHRNLRVAGRLRSQDA
ncbi:hypothetical protein G7Z17_g13085 [Cylindrodendrum hubeiense]|uniref:Uncharacterized protein n=1 Tax=Cylindrodendrum hubeiense TaxID=595255 RepID=A0A9P5L8L3_9HYPO|nr:hypothetical protein G7Z17_g13085 [Cylindrodendrum hubeiense]